MKEKAKIKHCPYCKEDITSGGIKCIHCLSILLSISLEIAPTGTRNFRRTVNPKTRMTYAKKKSYKTSDYQGAKAD